MSVLSYILAAIGYFAIGILWGFIRWRQYVDGEIEFYEAERKRFMLFHRIAGDEIPDFLIYEWRNYVKGNDRLRVVPPKAHDFRGEIAYDVILWWLSIAFLVVQTGFATTMKYILSEYNKNTDTKLNKIRKDLNMQQERKK
jgi:hypothetical protein